MRDVIEGLGKTERKKVLLVGAGVAVLLLGIILGTVQLLGGGSAGAEEVEEEAVLLDEGEVERRVEATVEAMRPAETATPEPTADIAATLQADMEANRERAQRVLKLNPLDSREVRNPYLNTAELAYLESLGDGLWGHTKAWFLLRELVETDVLEWSHLDLEHRVVRVEGYLGPRQDYLVGETEAVGKVGGPTSGRFMGGCVR